MFCCIISIGSFVRPIGISCGKLTCIKPWAGTIPGFHDPGGVTLASKSEPGIPSPLASEASNHGRNPGNVEAKTGRLLDLSEPYRA